MSLQHWEKRGLIFDPQGRNTWFISHAALPVPWIVDDRYRVYFSGRDREGRAQIGYFDVGNAGLPTSVSDSPVVSLGDLGTFDDRGVTSSCVVEHERRLYLYYTGWNLGLTVPFYYGIGLAISDDGGDRFVKASAAPVLGRNAKDPYLCASPAILIENRVWRMWYVSGARWVIENGEPKHYYHIKYAESRDGIQWCPTGRICIDFKSSDEYAIGRPCVLRQAEGYKMWYCYRGPKYRIGYAESRDGLEWERKDEEVGLDTSSSGWDSEELSYPYLLRMKGRLWMLYNGNGYGRTGIGLAVLRDA